MLSSSCRYGIRAVIYLAKLHAGNGETGIKKISKDLNLPTPFLAKILQQLTKNKILHSLKGPHGGFSLMKDPKKITLIDIIKTIDGEDIFTSCIIHNDTCNNVNKSKKACTLHDDYAAIRTELIRIFSSRTIHDLVQKTMESDKFII